MPRLYDGRGIFCLAETLFFHYNIGRKGEIAITKINAFF